MKDSPTIYYTFVNKPATGGDYVNVDHLNMLYKLGVNAKALVFDQYLDDAKNHPDLLAEFNCPAVLFRENITFSEQDIFIVPEVQKFLFSSNTIQNVPIRNVILHNQNPFFTHYGFESAKSLNEHCLKTIIVPSLYTQRRLEEVGVKKDFKVIYPYIPDYFYPREKLKEPIKIVYSARKRREEVKIMQFYLKSLYDLPYQIHFQNLEGLSREAVAKEMGEAAIFLSFAERESLGLMLLEAMASGCHVVGFSGYTDLHNMEVISHHYGDFINEGDYLTFTRKVIEAIEQFALDKPNEKQVRANALIESQFRRSHFEKQFKQVYSELLGLDLNAIT